MLIVPNVDALADFGFHKTGVTDGLGRDIWEKCIKSYADDALRVYLIVNPLGIEARRENVMVAVIDTTDKLDYIDEVFSLESLMDMLACGVVLWVQDADYLRPAHIVDSELMEEIKRCLNMPDDGEAVTGIVSAICTNLKNKVALRDIGSDVVGFIKNYEKAIERYRAEAQRNTVMRRLMEEHLRRVREACSRYMLDEKYQAITTDRGNLTVPEPSYSTVIDDIGLVPEAFLKTKTEIVPDKTAIKKAILSSGVVLASGIATNEKVSGAHLVESRLVTVT